MLSVTGNTGWDAAQISEFEILRLSPTPEPTGSALVTAPNCGSMTHHVDQWTALHARRPDKASPYVR